MKEMKAVKRWTKRGEDFEGNVNTLLNDEQKIEFDKFMKSRGPQPNQQQPNR